jgi:hypothetical protein
MTPEQLQTGITHDAEKKKIAARERVRKHRESLRARGLRPIQIWVPEARRQCLAANDPAHDKEIFDFMEAVLADTQWD